MFHVERFKDAMKAKRIDENQHEIVQALRKIGCSVFITSMVGNGYPDLSVGVKNHNLFFEVKRNEKEQLTPKEKYFKLTWQGQYDIITSIDQAIDIITRI